MVAVAVAAQVLLVVMGQPLPVVMVARVPHHQLPDLLSHTPVAVVPEHTAGLRALAVPVVAVLDQIHQLLQQQELLTLAVAVVVVVIAEQIHRVAQVAQVL